MIPIAIGRAPLGAQLVLQELDFGHLVVATLESAVGMAQWLR
jgi:hypothetical protein